MSSLDRILPVLRPLDALLVAAGSGVATFGLPGSAGVTEGTVADTVAVSYNDAAAVEAARPVAMAFSRALARMSGGESS